MKSETSNCSRKLLLLTLFSLILLFGAEGIQAQANQGPSDPAELEAFLDDLMAGQMEEHHIPGAAVSVVKDGKLFFTKGYGYADLGTRTPVDPYRTLFRIGSGTKLFTATAVMQLVEKKKLDLDADVNIYLDFQIPDTFLEPITLKHLMVHTAGFDVSGLNIGTRSAEDLLPIGEWLRKHMRARVRPPGQYPAYSNYGMTLAGYIVERVSGLPYEQYIELNILQPLGMGHTTARQPLPAELAPDYHTGYVYSDGEYQSVYQLGLGDSEFENVHVPPAGSITSSATDMARFMIAHLQNGRYAGTRILKEATAQQMHSTLFTYEPGLNGLCYAFWELSWNDLWIIGHPGDVITHHSMLALLPDQNLGIFAAWNGEGGLQLNEGPFLHAFLDRYYPVSKTTPIPLADAVERADRYTGSYRMSAMADTTWEKMMAIFGALNLKDGGDGTLVLNTPYGEQKWVEVEPLVFHEIGGQDMVIFEEDDQGPITRGYIHSVPRMVIEKLLWYETPGFHMPLLLGCILIFLSMIITGLINLIRRRRPEGLQHWRPLAAGSLSAAISVLFVLFTAGLFIFMGNMTWYSVFFGTPTFLKVLLALPVLAAVLTVGALIFTALAWKGGYWKVAGRIHYTLVALAAVAFIWSLNFLNLLGWRV